MKRNNYLFLFLLAGIGGAFLSIAYINPYDGTIGLSELVLQLSGSRGDLEMGFSMPELTAFAMRILPECIFEGYMGIMIYRHFCTASIYIFSRCTNRSKWYWTEMLFLGLKVLIFQILLLFVAVITTLLRYPVTVDSAGMLLFLYHLVIRFLWVFLWVIFINLLAIRKGSSRSFTVAMIVKSSCIAVLGLGSFFKAGGRGVNLFLKINPAARLVLGWHESRLKIFKQELAPPYHGLYLEESLAFYVFAVICILVIGANIIKKYDFLISDSEMGAV